MTSYITPADARIYALANGIILPEIDADDDGIGLQTYLNRASIYLDRLFGDQYIGIRSNSVQQLYWPRTVTSTYDSLGNNRDDFDGIIYPLELGLAATELASKLFNEQFDPFIQPDPALLEESKQLDVMKTTKKYDVPYAKDPLYALKLILKPLLRTTTTKKITMTRGA